MSHDEIKNFIKQDKLDSIYLSVNVDLVESES